MAVTNNEWAEIFHILAKYQEVAETGAERDALYVGVKDSERISDEDFGRLGDLGCRWDEELESFRVYT